MTPAVSVGFLFRRVISDHLEVPGVRGRLYCAIETQKKAQVSTKCLYGIKGTSTLYGIKGRVSRGIWTNESGPHSVILNIILMAPLSIRVGPPGVSGGVGRGRVCLLASLGQQV